MKNSMGRTRGRDRSTIDIFKKLMVFFLITVFLFSSVMPVSVNAVSDSEIAGEAGSTGADADRYVDSADELPAGTGDGSNSGTDAVNQNTVDGDDNAPVDSDAPGDSGDTQDSDTPGDPKDTGDPKNTVDPERQEASGEEEDPESDAVDHSGSLLRGGAGESGEAEMVLSSTGETIIDPGTGGVETDKDDSFELSKGVNVTNVLPGNSFTLTLEANATGTTTSENTSGAANILLVLENTTSMRAVYGSTTRLAAVQEAAGSFINGLPDNTESQIAMLSFVCGGDGTSPTTTDVGWTALDNTSKDAVTTAVNGLTAPDLTFGYDTNYVTPINAAVSYVDETGNNNPTYVVFFTDGDDLNSQETLESAANTLKNKVKDVFSIGIVQARYFTDDEEAFRAKAKAIASQEDYYFEPATAADLTAAFNQALQVIQDDISASNTTLDAASVFKDVVNTEKFDISDAVATVTVYDYDNGEWKLLEGGSAAANIGGSGSLDSWANKSSEDGTLTVNLSEDGTVTITGFSYKDHYLPANDQEADGINAQRIHLEISGIKLREGAQETLDQTDVPTNAESQSGIFRDPSATAAVKYFPLPKVNIPGKGGVSQTTDNVQNITVKKEWIGEAADSVEVELLEDGAVKDTQTLSADNNWSFTWEELDETKTYAVAEKSVYKDGENVTAQYTPSISEPESGTSTKTVTEWVKKDYLTADTITNGGTYAFSYDYSVRTYLLGVSTNSNPSAAGVGTTVQDGVVTDFPENAQWIVTASGAGYTLRNKYTNTYLVMGNNGGLSMGDTGSVFDMDDADGSIHSGGYNIRCYSYPTTSPTFYTAFIAYELTDKTINIASAEYTITNTKQDEVPVINTGVPAEDQKPLAALILCIAVLGSLMTAKNIINRRR